MSVIAATAHRPTRSSSIRAALTPQMLELAAGPMSVHLDEGWLDSVADCHRFVLDRLADGATIYGATAGFGPLVGYAGRQDDVDQCRNVLDHLDAGQGPDLEPAAPRVGSVGAGGDLIPLAYVVRALLPIADGLTMARRR